MSVAKAVSSSLRCNGCRFAIVRSFAAFSGVELGIVNERRSSSNGVEQQQKRAFSGTTNRPSEQQRVKAEEEDNKPIIEEIGVNNVKRKPSQGAPIPWYLQVQQSQSTRDESHPLA